MKKIIAAGLAAAGLIAALYWLNSRPRAEQAFIPQRFAGETLVIDAGHGGEDGGAVSASGASESAINLAVARRLDAIMGLYGVNTVMLRTQDVMLNDADAGDLRARKVSDLHNRAAAVNAVEHAVLISIHQNSFPDPQYDGAQVFYAPTQGSQFFAEYTQELLRVSLSPENNRQAKPIASSVYLMNHIDCKGILVECGFLTNPAEDRLLQTPDYQLKLAVTLAGSYFQTVQIGQGEPSPR